MPARPSPSARVVRRPNPIVLLALTWLLTRVVGWLTGWRYDPFTEGLVAGKLVVDLAIWLGLSLVVGVVLARLAGAGTRAPRPRGTPRRT